MEEVKFILDEYSIMALSAIVQFHENAFLGYHPDNGGAEEAALYDSFAWLVRNYLELLLKTTRSTADLSKTELINLFGIKDNE